MKIINPYVEQIGGPIDGLEFLTNSRKILESILGQIKIKLGDPK